MTLYTSVNDPKPAAWANWPVSSNRRVRRSVLFYLGVTLICIIIDKVYALFGHGVTSPAMDLMFLYPLLGGALPFLLLWLLVPVAAEVRGYRLFVNSHNSGIATLTTASMLTGVFAIAGTESPYLIAFAVVGWAMVGFGVGGYLLNLGRRLL